MLSSTLHIFPRGQVDLESFPVLVRQVGKPPIEHGFGRRDQLDNDRMPVGNRCFDCRQQARELHRQKQLREEALLCPLKDRQRCGLGPGVERAPGLAVDDPRGFQRIAQIGVDDCLSRGSGNAKERGVGAGFQGCGTKLLRIILIANLGGLWTS